ncbi:MAG: histidine--tRNA ligase [Flavobacteriaceae bacterium]|nr:histidine--tRNA ligase [Flavobacteriaceae bacterium]
MAQKPSIPKGTRDFSPTEITKRNYIFNIIKKSFELYGFQPIETPSFEKSETLMGKYGEEGDRLIFKILESGQYFEKAQQKIFFIDDKTLTLISDLLTSIFQRIRKDLKDTCTNEISIKNLNIISEYISKNICTILNNSPEIIYINQFEERIAFYFKENSRYIAADIVNRKYFFDDETAFDRFRLAEQKNIQTDLFERLKSYYVLNTSSNKLTSLISEKALRYDLTVPFARYVVQHQNELTLPFKRYQIQPVWRADRPQKGRFREFYQCDADVVGSTSLIQEVEFVQLYDAVFTKLGLTETIIKVNNRKILSGIAEIIGAKDKLIDFTVALDKLDKIGVDGVTKEMLSKGISEDAIKKVQPLFSFKGSNRKKLIQLKEMLATSEEGLKGVSELQFIVDAIDNVGLQSAILDIDVTLARGLNYYTGVIYEVIINKVKIGSIGGGGRYDDLTSIFGLKNLSGIGISFGLDRIYIVLEELDLFKDLELPKPKVLFLNYNAKNIPNRLQALASLRANGIAAEIYPDTATSNKQQQKQFKYLQKRAIKFVVLDDEIGENLRLKNTITGEIIEGNIKNLLLKIKN